MRPGAVGLARGVAGGGQRRRRPFRLSAPDHAELAPWPYDISQLTDGTDEPGEPSDPANDCGPASIAACLQYLTGRRPHADDIRDAIYGQGYRGYTYAVDLADYVTHMWGLAAEARQDAHPALTIRAALAHGWPVVALTQEPGYTHFCPITAFDRDGVTRHQVLGGWRERLTWEAFEARYLGWLIVVTSRRVDG